MSDPPRPRQPWRVRTKLVQGPPGAGITGPAGPQGAAGTSGASGAAGSQGIQGPAGATGSQGAKGDTGAIGPQGIQGTAGTTGATGATGSQGVPGTTGAAGGAGATGAQGPAGPAPSGTGLVSVNAGVAGAITIGTDATINPVTGALILAASGASAGTVGDATHVGAVTVDLKGRVTSASAVAIALTLGGDVTGAHGSNVVAGLTGASGVVAIGATSLQATQGNTGLTIGQAQQVNGSAPVNMVWAPQAPGSGAATTANGTGGSAVISLPAPVSTGAEAQFIVQRGGVNIWDLCPNPAQPTWIQLWAGPQATPGGKTSTNYTLAVEAAQAVINGSVVNLRIGGGANLVFLTGTIFNTSGVGRVVKRVTIVTTYSVSTSDDVVLCNGSAAFTITLPAPATGRLLTIKDISGSAGTKNITVSHNASETIDGATTQIISTNFGVLRLTSDGTNWYII